MVFGEQYRGFMVGPMSVVEKICILGMSYWGSLGLKSGRPSGQLSSKFDEGPQKVKTKGPNCPRKGWLISIPDVQKELEKNKSSRWKKMRIPNSFILEAQIAPWNFQLILTPETNHVTTGEKGCAVIELVFWLGVLNVRLVRFSSQ